MNTLQKKFSTFVTILLFAYAANAAILVGNDGNPGTSLFVDAPFVGTSGDFDVNGSAFVDNYVEVTTPDAPSSIAITTSPTDLDPWTETSTTTTTTVVSPIGTTSINEIDGASGGVLIENNGDVTLSQYSGTETQVEVVEASKYDVYNADQTNAGQIVPGTQKYVAGYVTGGGDFVEISPAFPTKPELDNWIATTPLDDAAYHPVRNEANLSGFGGNLQVGGDANVDGVFSVANNGAGGVADVDAAINGNTAANLATQADVDQNEADSDAADLQLQANIDDAIINMQAYVDTAVAQARAEGVASGIQTVLNDPTSYDLYDESSILDLNAGTPILSMTNQANEAEVEFVIESSTDLETWTVDERIKRTVVGQGKKYFVRIQAGAPFVEPE